MDGYLDNVAHNIYGDFNYNLYPYPAPNEKMLASLFGKSKKKKSIGYVIKNKRVLKVYKRNDREVTYDGKSIGSRKVYKTLTSAKSALNH